MIKELKEETIDGKCIDKIIESISASQQKSQEKDKYSIDIRKILEKLKSYEVSTPITYKENNWSAAVNYYEKVLETISKDWVAGNSFNHCGRTRNDIQYFYHEGDNQFYIAICFNIRGEARNFASYIQVIVC